MTSIIKYEDISPKEYILKESKSIIYLTAVFSVLFLALIWEILQSSPYALPQAMGYLYALGTLLFAYMLSHGLRKKGFATYIIANKDGVFIPFEPSKNLFLQLPWKVIKKIKKGMYGSNHRGISFLINDKHLKEEQKDLLKQSPSIHVKNELSINAITGLQKREPVLEKLTEFQNN